MQERKEYILQKAFEVFMAKGYDSTSMTVLHKKLNMSRGAMYRYFPSKEDLFKAVIDRYVLGLFDMLKPDLDFDNITIIEKMDLTYTHLAKIGKFFDEIDNIEVKFLNYTALIIQAAKRYPGFLDKLKAYKENSLNEWKIAVENSIKKGEIRSDIDVDCMAVVFSKVFNLVDDSNDIDKGFLRGIKGGKKTFTYIYSLIKV